MTYKEIREAMKAPKDKSHKKTMNIVDYGRLSIMYSDKTDAIIVDSCIAKQIGNRRWCVDACGYPVTNVNGLGVVRLFDYVLSQSYEYKPCGCYVDHLNHDKLDNRKENLRFVVPGENVFNMPLRANNTSGATGVSKTKKGTYRAYITINKKRIELGTYKSLQEAQAARMTAESKYDFYARPQSLTEYMEQQLTTYAE